MIQAKVIGWKTPSMPASAYLTPHQACYIGWLRSTSLEKYITSRHNATNIAAGTRCAHCRKEIK